MELAKVGDKEDVTRCWAAARWSPAAAVLGVVGVARADTAAVRADTVGVVEEVGIVGDKSLGDPRLGGLERGTLTKSGSKGR